MDKMIGKLVSQLDEEGWLENSIIMVASDNGGCPTNGGSNYPLRGIKHSYWEGGNKVTLAWLLGARVVCRKDLCSLLLDQDPEWRRPFCRVAWGGLASPHPCSAEAIFVDGKRFLYHNGTVAQSVRARSSKLFRSSVLWCEPQVGLHA